jgi:hypothetical protein
MAGYGRGSDVGVGVMLGIEGVPAACAIHSAVTMIKVKSIASVREVTTQRTA